MIENRHWFLFILDFACNVSDDKMLHAGEKLPEKVLKTKAFHSVPPLVVLECIKSLLTY